MTTVNPEGTAPAAASHLRVVPDAAERAESVAGLVDTYARMADELAAMVEAEARRAASVHAGLAAALGQLHTELDELAALAEPAVRRVEEFPVSPSSRPPVVVLCGSTRFLLEMAQAAREETVAGRIVLRPDCDLRTPDPLWPAGQIGQVKRNLDVLHRAKIRLADEVLVIAPGGYIGDSTRAEIAYATELGCPVRYWGDR